MFPPHISASITFGHGDMNLKGNSFLLARHMMLPLLPWSQLAGLSCAEQLLGTCRSLWDHSQSVTIASFLPAPGLAVRSSVWRVEHLYGWVDHDLSFAAVIGPDTIPTQSRYSKLFVD